MLFHLTADQIGLVPRELAEEWSGKELIGVRLKVVRYAETLDQN